MTVNKTPAKQHSENRWRTARASLRMHPDLRAAVDFLAQADRRTVSQFLEMMVLDRVRWALMNRFDDDGQHIDRGPFRFKDGRDPRLR